MTNEKIEYVDVEIGKHDSYLTYKRKFDFYNKTSYAHNHKLITVKPMPERYVKMFYPNGTYDTAPNTDVETETNTDVHETPENTVTDDLNDDTQTVLYNNGHQRRVIGDYNDPETVIKKSFLHLNAMKRAQTLSLQSDDEYNKLFHENIMYREQNALELSLRNLQQLIKKQK